MNKNEDGTMLSRRTFLQTLAAGAVGTALGPYEAVFAQEGEAAYAPFRMGMQSYSLRGYKVDEALAKTQALGLTWWEGFDAHFPITDDPKILAEYKDKLRAHGIRMVTYGVVDFHNNEADARRKFEFARAMEIVTLSASPSADSFPLLNMLTKEYKINIGIHNHGPGDELYDTIQKVWNALQGQSPRIGACVDTGHYLRSNQDPVAAVRKFGRRVYGVHLKDVKTGPNGEKQFTEIGKGALDTVGLLRALKASHYNSRGIVSLEYEEHADDPMPYIQECLAATRAAIEKLRG